MNNKKNENTKPFEHKDNGRGLPITTTQTPMPKVKPPKKADSNE